MARRSGVDLRAVTAWSVFGAVDWNTLIDENNNHYEPGIFDVRSPQPRATELAEVWRRLGSGKVYSHPIMEVPGWWQRPERLIHNVKVENSGAVTVLSSAPSPAIHERYLHVRPILITGATGTLGRQLGSACETRALPYRLLTRTEMEIADAQSVATAISRYRPWAVVNAAGYVRVDEAEHDYRAGARMHTAQAS